MGTILTTRRSCGRFSSCLCCLDSADHLILHEQSCPGPSHLCWCGERKSEPEVQQSWSWRWMCSGMGCGILQLFYFGNAHCDSSRKPTVTLSQIVLISSSRRASVQHEEYSVSAGKSHGETSFTRAICLSLPLENQWILFLDGLSLSLKIFIGTPWVNKVHLPAQINSLKLAGCCHIFLITGRKFWVLKIAPGAGGCKWDNFYNKTHDTSRNPVSASASPLLQLL